MANRDELIELVVDEIYRELELPGEDGTSVGADDGREAARRLAHSIRSTTLRHPWVVSMLDRLVGATFFGPNLAKATERMFALFEGAGFELPEAERALNTLNSYVFGVAMGEAAWHNWLVRHGSRRKSGSTNPGAWSTRRQGRSGAASHHRHRYEGTDPEKVVNDDFESGLERVLDGLQARLDGRS